MIKGLTSGIEGLFKKNNVEYMQGWASFEDKNTLKVLNSSGSESTVKAKHVIIATGSSVSALPGVEIDEK